jgi:putative transposase
MRGKSKALKTQQGKDCMMSNLMSGAIQLQLPLFATVGSIPSSKHDELLHSVLLCLPVGFGLTLTRF